MVFQYLVDIAYTNKRGIDTHIKQSSGSLMLLFVNFKGNSYCISPLCFLHYVLPSVPFTRLTPQSTFLMLLKPFSSTKCAIPFFC